MARLRRLALLMLLLPAAAQAELGGAVASVTADGARLGARMQHLAGPAYTRHVLTRPNGGAVHELTNAQGRVFAVSWAGPGKPDLRQLLGPYFSALQPSAPSSPGAIGRTMHGFRRPVAVARDDLQIQEEGHMGWFRGTAFVPSLAPAGFQPADLVVQP